MQVFLLENAIQLCYVKTKEMKIRKKNKFLPHCEYNVSSLGDFWILFEEQCETKEWEGSITKIMKV
jgi:hypothetical protein